MSEQEKTQPPATFSTDEAAGIIREASRIQQESGGTLSHADVISMAKELGVSEESVAKALERRTEQEQERKRARARLVGLANHVTSYLGSIAFLGVIDYMTGPGWWVQWIAVPWGVFVAMHAVRAAIGLDSEGDKKRQGDGAPKA